MKSVFQGLLMACLIPFISQAVDEHFETLKVGDDVFDDVTVTSVTATDVYFTHSRGIGNAKLSQLANDVQRKLGFDAKKAASVARSQREGAKLFAARMQQERIREQEKASAARQKADAEAAAAERRIRQLAAAQANAGSLMNRQAPPLAIEKWLTDTPDPTGKFVLIDFWATWCGPCRSSIPHLNALQRKYSDRLLVIGISNEPEEAVRRMSEPAIEYSSAIDTRSRTARQVGVTSIPHALLIDPSGIVRYQGHPSSLTEGVLENILTRFGS